MNHDRRNKVALALAALLLGADSWASQRVQDLIGVVATTGHAREIDTSAGCFFSKEGGNGTEHVFIESTGTWVNLDGTNLQLTALADAPGLWPDAKGKRATLRYQGGGASVELEVERTTQCEEGEECAGAGYEGRLIVRKGNREQTMKIFGGCGC